MSIAALYNVSLDYLVGFEKKEMVSVEGLTESQKGIIHSLVFEFHDPKQAAVGFSERQQAIMRDVYKRQVQPGPAGTTSRWTKIPISLSPSPISASVSYTHLEAAYVNSAICFTGCFCTHN